MAVSVPTPTQLRAAARVAATSPNADVASFIELMKPSVAPTMLVDAMADDLHGADLRARLEDWPTGRGEQA